VLWADARPAAALSPSRRAGYTAALSGAVARSHAGFQVPSLSCDPADSFMAASALAEVFSPTDVIAGGVVLVCANGTPTYTGVIQLGSGNQTSLPDPVAPGDHVVAAVNVTASKTTVTVSDRTRHWTHTLSGAGATGISDGFVGVSALNCTAGAMPCSTLPKFSPIQFRSARVDRLPIGRLHPSRSDIVSSGGQLEASTSSLGNGGSEFVVTWQASCAPDPTTNRC
jgi:hypothetical protein